MTAGPVVTAPPGGSGAEAHEVAGPPSAARSNPPPPLAPERDRTPGAADDLASIAWPLARTGEALQVLARRYDFPLSPNAVPTPPPAAHRSEEEFARWLDATASWLGLEVEPVDSPYGDLADLLRRAAPALVRVTSSHFLVLLGATRRGLTVMSPDLSTVRLDPESVRAAMCGPIEAPVRAELDAWLPALVGGGARGERARAAMVRERLSSWRIGGVWLVRLPPGASFLAQVRADRILGRAGLLLVAHLSTTLLGVGAWAMFGRGALDGHLERAWLVAWGLLLVTTIPFRLLGLWAQGQVAIGLGKLMKRRLLAGALRIDPEVIRREGSGQLLGRTMEAAAIEGLAMSAGFAAALALIEFAVVITVLALGGAGPPHAILLAAFVAMTLGIGWRNYKQTLSWTEHRRAMTNDLVEQMAGHRTRLAQQSPAHWHDGEDEMLDEYMSRSRNKDRIDILLFLLPQAWFIVGLIGFAPTFVAGGTPGALAISLGGVLLGVNALTSLTAGLGQIAAAGVAWKQVSPLFHAASAPALIPSPTYVVSSDPPAPRPRLDVSHAKAALLDAADLVFAYRGRPMPVIKGGSLRIDPGDRLLLEGPSGGGKSTLASLITGLRQPLSGLLLLDGLDWHTLGPDGWRRRIVAAPQFQENHVLSDTFAFNLLMGRGWPPTMEDLQAAEEMCVALGLGDLLQRMPGGLMQMVGDSGWNLSHGERSRLYIARALLQKASLVVLDESFAALDPKTLAQCLRCAIERAPALLVIAHP